MGTSKSTRPIPIRTQNITVLRVDTHHQQHHQIVVTRDVCEIPQMATLIVQQGAWVWAWEQIETVLAATHPSPYTRRREKTETTSYPPLGTSTRIVHDPQKTREAVRAEIQNTGPTMIGVVERFYIL